MKGEKDQRKLERKENRKHKKYPAFFGAGTNVEFLSCISISPRRFLFIKNNW